MIVDILLYTAAAALTMYLLLNLAVYLIVRQWMVTNLRNLKRILEEENRDE